MRPRHEMRRVEELALHLDDHTMDKAGAELAVGLQGERHLLEGGVAAIDGDRPGGRHDGGELGIGEVNGRHGGRRFGLAR
jgi:hypothetical protein